jgi:predicted porin
MKKHLIAAAVAVAFAAPAMAQVTVYGKANIGYAKDSGSDGKLESGADGSDSRVGLKGSEDLGGGMKANFLFEHGLKPDTGTTDSSTKMWQRSSWVGLSGGFGEVRLGRQYTLGFLGVIGQMPSTAVASDLRVGLGFQGEGSRADDQIQYHSPKMGGVQLRVSTQLDGDTANAPTTAYALVYGAGALSAAANYSKTDNGSDANTSVWAAYNFGPAALAVGSINSNAGDGTWARVKVPMGATTLFAGMAKNDDTDADATEVGAFYALSKRTRVYALYSSMDNANRTRIGLDHNF